jgi:hypothetical protein
MQNSQTINPSLESVTTKIQLGSMDVFNIKQARAKKKVRTAKPGW